MTIRQKDFFYLLPYLYSLYAFANIQLRRYEVALKAAEDMLSLASTNPQQRIVALFYKVCSINGSLQHIVRSLERVSRTPESTT